MYVVETTHTYRARYTSSGTELPTMNSATNHAPSPSNESRRTTLLQRAIDTNTTEGPNPTSRRPLSLPLPPQPRPPSSRRRRRP